MKTISADGFEPSKVVAELLDGSGAVPLSRLFTEAQVEAVRDIFRRETGDHKFTGSAS